MVIRVGVLTYLLTHRRKFLTCFKQTKIFGEDYCGKRFKSKKWYRVNEKIVFIIILWKL